MTINNIAEFLEISADEFDIDTIAREAGEIRGRHALLDPAEDFDELWELADANRL